MSLSPIDSDDYKNALQRLQGTAPVLNKQLFGLVGQTSNGSLVLFPGSLEKGYLDSLLPPEQRPYYTWNLGFVGQLSDGSTVFPPSYDVGTSNGLNELRFAILAEGERRLHQQNQDLLRRLETQGRELETAQTRISELQKRFEDSKGTKS